MSSPNNGLKPSVASFISSLLLATKKELENLVSGGSIAIGLGQEEVDALQRDVVEIHRLTRSYRNRLAPINRIPPEVLSSIPDFSDGHHRNVTAYTLTHVCRIWRQVFISRPSLWTDFCFLDADKTRVYLERSRSFPINVRLVRANGLLPGDPFLQITPHVVHRLECLFIKTTPHDLHRIVDRLSYPAPLLNNLRINGSSDNPEINPVLGTTLFGGDLSSLHSLGLMSVRTNLPWRNMANLTSFFLHYALHPRVTVGQLLDFFESAPRLSNVELHFSTPDVAAQTGRLLSMTNLRRLWFYGFRSPSLLLDHLLIPAGAKLETYLGIPSLRIEDHLPRSLDNLRNLPSFNKICLRFNGNLVALEFSGPSGQVSMSAVFHSFGSTPSSTTRHSSASRMSQCWKLSVNPAAKTFIRRSHPWKIYEPSRFPCVKTYVTSSSH